MKTFGLGFLRSVSSRQHQAHTLASLLAPYSVMESCLDKAAMLQNNTNTKLQRFWCKIKKDVEKSSALREDVAMLGGNHLPLVAAARYVAAVQDAALNRCNENNPGSEVIWPPSHFLTSFQTNFSFCFIILVVWNGEVIRKHVFATSFVYSFNAHLMPYCLLDIAGIYTQKMVWY